MILVQENILLWNNGDQDQAHCSSNLPDMKTLFQIVTPRTGVGANIGSPFQEVDLQIKKRIEVVASSRWRVPAAPFHPFSYMLV